MTSTHDDSFREIQLSGKQLVFLFMAVVVILVGTFLMGLQVGRGVVAARGAPESGGTVAAAEAEPPPPPSSASPGTSTSPATAGEKLSYAERLGSAEPAKEQLKAEATSAARETAPPPKTPGPESGSARPEAAATPAPPAAAPPSTTGSSEPAGAGFAIQVAALRERAEADTIVKRLAAKGYPAYVVTPAKGAPSVFRVRVGKYDERHEADSVAARLQKEEQFKPWIVQVVRPSTAAAVLSGVLLALSFPRYGHPAVAFVALVPLLVALSGWSGRSVALPGVSSRRGFTLGLIAGFIHFAGTVYWTGATVSTFGGIPPIVAVLVAGLLALYMAAYVAVFAAITAILVRRFRVIGLWLAPAAWVTMEYLRGILIGGFPWIPLGNTMVTLLPIAQLASIAGVYGLSIFVAVLNSGFALAAISNGRRRTVSVATTLTLLVAVSIWGGFRLRSNTLTHGVPIQVGLIQGNIAQTDKWNPARAGMILDRYLQLSRQAVDNGAQFLIWPESSTPFNFDEHPTGNVIRQMVRDLRTPLLLGSDEVESGEPPKSYNSGFMIDTAGATAAVYRKMHLVPFGEYVPFQRLLFFVGPLVDAVSAFSRGTRVTMLPVEGHMVSTAICYEVTYPSQAREAVKNGSEMLTTITNDAWYGESSAPYQHFEMAAMRAIEQGRYLVRSANTGISGIVDPYGRVLIRTKLFETVAVVGEARFVQATTVYATIGDLAAYGSAAIVALALALAFVEGRKTYAA